MLYMLGSCLFRLTHPPIFMGSIAMFWGWLKSFLTRMPRYDDPEFRKFLTRYQWRCLAVGKQQATQDTEARQLSHWHPDAPVRA
jgi:biofilm PGA synthesis N-glycosyltransferase PgaC